MDLRCHQYNLHNLTHQPSRRCSAQMDPKLNLLAFMQKATSVRNQILHIILNTPSPLWNMLVAASSCCWCFSSAGTGWILILSTVVVGVYFLPGFVMLLHFSFINFTEWCFSFNWLHLVSSITLLSLIDDLVFSSWMNCHSLEGNELKARVRCMIQPAKHTQKDTQTVSLAYGFHLHPVHPCLPPEWSSPCIHRDLPPSAASPLASGNLPVLLPSPSPYWTLCNVITTFSP